MSIITFSQSKREYTEGVGSLYQREVLAYLVSLKFKFSFKRSRLIFYTLWELANREERIKLN